MICFLFQRPFWHVITLRRHVVCDRVARIFLGIQCSHGSKGTACPSGCLAVSDHDFNGATLPDNRRKRSGHSER